MNSCPPVTRTRTSPETLSSTDYPQSQGSAPSPSLVYMICERVKHTHYSLLTCTHYYDIFTTSKPDPQDAQIKNCTIQHCRFTSICASHFSISAIKQTSSCTLNLCKLRQQYGGFVQTAGRTRDDSTQRRAKPHPKMLKDPTIQHCRFTVAKTCASKLETLLQQATPKGGARHDTTTYSLLKCTS